MESIANCSNFYRSTDSLLKVKTVKEMIPKLVLNTVFHHVNLSCIISSNKQMKYYTKEHNHPYWLNKGQRYNTAICSRLHGTVFDDFIVNY